MNLKNWSLGTRSDAPASVAEGSAPAVGRLAVREGGVGRILVADDDGAMRALVRHVLRRFASDFDHATNGFELATYLHEGGPYDLVVTDVRMAGMTGVHAMIAARNSGLTTPFIVMTAFPEEPIRQLVESTERSVLLSKPFQARELHAAARSFGLEERQHVG